MKKYLVVVMAVMLLCIGCGRTDTPDTEENTQQMETETQTESEVPSEPEAPTYTYTDMDKTMYAKSSVNVRDLPSTDGNKLGGLSKAQEVHVTGQCNETSWYRIEYNGGVGYVSSNYLVDEKPVEVGGTGPNCAVISALYTDQETGFPIWSIDYVWD